MGGANRQAKLRRKDHRERCRKRDAERPGLIQFGDFAADGLNQAWAEQHQANGQTQGTHHHDPQGNIR